MNKKAQGMNTIKNLILLVSIAIVLLIITIGIVNFFDRTRTSSLCTAQIALSSQGKGELNCPREKPTNYKETDFDDIDKLKKKILTRLVSCTNGVGFGEQNPYIQDRYRGKSNCLVCSELYFEKEEKIREIPYWSTYNFVPGSKTDYFFDRMTQHTASGVLVQQFMDLNDLAVVDTSENYSVLWKVDKKGYWDKLLQAKRDNNPLVLTTRDNTVYEYRLLGNTVNEAFIIGKDFFGFVINVDTDLNDEEFVSSIWIGTDRLILSSFDITETVQGTKGLPDEVTNVGNVCYYMHN